MRREALAMWAILAATMPDAEFLRPKNNHIRYRSREATYPNGHDKKFFTLVGSRYNAPKEDLDKLYEIAVRLLGLGLIGRSGCAPGSDHQLTRATALFDCAVSELYLPWDGFEGFSDGMLNGAVLLAPAYDNYDAARNMACELHPVWKMLGNGGKMLHSRNPYQALGKDLATPSEFVIYSAPVDKYGNIKGGTATAVKLAVDNKVPSFNIQDPEGLFGFESWLDEWRCDNSEWIEQNRRLSDEEIRDITERS